MKIKFKEDRLFKIFWRGQRRGEIMNLIIIFLLTISCSMFMVRADVRPEICENRCTPSQICMKDGACFDPSDLVRCPFTSFDETNYCKKGQECCGTGCMPEGKVCCLTLYCETGHTCCSFTGCCPAGTFCSGFRCIDDKYSTRKPTTVSLKFTSKQRTTSTMSTTKLLTNTMSITRYPTRTYPTSTNSSTGSGTRHSSEWTTKDSYKAGTSPASDSESAFKPWHYAIIVIDVMFVIFVSA